MDINTIIAGLNALGGLFGGNDPIPMTPAQAEEEKPKKQQQVPMNSIFILPNQTPPMGLGVPPAFPLAGMLADQIYRLPQQNPAPVVPSLLDLYRLYYGLR
jgi:hypothetical protein